MDLLGFSGFRHKAGAVPRPGTRKSRAREIRMLAYLVILAGVAGWRFIPRPWHPSTTVQTPDFLIYSTATKEQTDKTAQAMEFLYEAYSSRLGALKTFQPEHPRLQVKLFKDRAQFRWVNPNLGWAEAFYREPYCRAYFSADEPNPYHWMLHESVHQLNHEVAHLKLAKWLEEGLAEYFSTSVLNSNRLVLGQIDPNTYPVWWIDELAIDADLTQNLHNRSVIPLRAIITNRGGPGLNREFNLYYLHWWTLTHYIFEDPRCRSRALELVRRGGGLAAFEETLGPVERVQEDWHRYVRHLKELLAGRALGALKAERIPQSTNPPAEDQTSSSPSHATDPL